MMHNRISQQRIGTALVVSGPSGAGKTTVCKLLLGLEPNMCFSVSCTTRPPRPGETDAVDYHFLSRHDFEERIQKQEFLEHAEVHGNYYGTLRSDVEDRVREGRHVLLDIDVQGARQVRDAVKGGALEVAMVYAFIGPPSCAEMERRLRNRGTDSEEVIGRRLKNSRDELRAWTEYDYLVINDAVDGAVAQLHAIVRAAGCRTSRITEPPWPELENAHDTTC